MIHIRFVYYGNSESLEGESGERLRIREKWRQQVSQSSNCGSQLG